MNLLVTGKDIYTNNWKLVFKLLQTKFCMSEIKKIFMDSWRTNNTLLMSYPGIRN